MASVVTVRDVNQRQPRGQFGRTVGNMLGEAVGHRPRCVTTSPESPFRIALRFPQWRLGIAPQYGGKGPLITGLGSQLVQRGG